MRVGRFFLDFYLYFSLYRSLFFYFFDGLARGADNGAWREIAQFGMGDDPFDRGGGCFDCSGFGQVADGDLKAVEEQAGALVVDVAASEALQDLADRTLDGAAVFERRQLKEGGLVAVDAHRLGGETGSVVVVAELFQTQAGATAAVAIGEDVAAAVASGWLSGWLGDVVWHSVSPLYLSPKVFKRKGLPLDFEADPVKCESPAFCRAVLLTGLIIANRI